MGSVVGTITQLASINDSFPLCVYIVFYAMEGMITAWTKGVSPRTFGRLHYIGPGEVAAYASRE